MKVFLLDNYDVFTYNLVQLVARVGADVTVARNDQVTVAEVEGQRRMRIVISPVSSRRRRGSASSSCSGWVHRSRSWVSAWGTRRSVWPTARRSCACRRCTARHGRSITQGSARSRACPRRSMPRVTTHLPLAPWRCRTSWRSPPGRRIGVIMAIRHRSHPVEGFQFHPESILTADGEALLAGFLGRVAAVPSA